MFKKLIDKLYGAKNETYTYTSANNDEMRYLFGTERSKITANNAQKIATVFACVNIKANYLSIIPIELYKKISTGKEEWRDNPLYNLLRYEPNPNLTASQYKKMISQDLDLRGNHYTQIVRNGLGQVVALYPLVADKMAVTVKDGKKSFRYDGKPVSAIRIMHIYDIPNEDGTIGISKIQYAKQTLEFASNTSEHGNQLFKNSSMPSGAFENAGTLSEPAFERLKEDLKKRYTGLKNNGTPMLLEEGLKYNPLQITNSDSEWLESRKFNREEIGAIFGVPVSKLNDSTNTAYGNLEQKELEFYTGTILPLTTVIEETQRMKLLTKEDKKNGFVKFKYNAMLRVEAKTRAEYNQIMWNISAKSANEIRRNEDMNDYVGGDQHFREMSRTSIENPEPTNKEVTNNEN